MEEENMQRQALRAGYQHLLEDVTSNREDMQRTDNDSVTSINETLDKANDLFRNVKNPREATLDSHLLCQVANITRKRTEALSADLRTFQPLEFIERLITFMDPHELLQERENPFPDARFGILGQSLLPYFKRSPSFHYMNGAFERGAVDLKRIRKPKSKDDSAESKEMKASSYNREASKTEQEKTTEEIESILGILHAMYDKNKKHPICYFEFVTDPESYSKTVENIFHVSFLVKDNAAKIYLDADNLPVIEPVIIHSGSSRTDQQTSKQLIISLTKEEWKEIVSVFKIKQGRLSNRGKTKRKK